MNVRVGNYRAIGPHHDPKKLPITSGVCAMIGRGQKGVGIWHVIDFCESNNIRQIAEKRFPLPSYPLRKFKEIAFAAIPANADRRAEIVQELEDSYHLTSRHQSNINLSTPRKYWPIPGL